MMRKCAEVRVPATTANLGPGYDCLGMALDIWNVVRLEAGRSVVVIEGEGSSELSQGQDNLVLVAARTLLQRVGVQAPELALYCSNAIPLARGLGSSSAAIVGGLVAANTLVGERLSPQQMLEMAVEMEGHPDNVAAALYGGCQVVLRDGDGLMVAPVPLPEGLKAVLFIPDEAMPTAQARAILPGQVTREDAVFNAARTALLVDALATGHLEYLRVATQDRLHQPQRGVLFPAMERIFQAALDAGALGAFLSGAGSTILALAQGREMTIGYGMAEAARRVGVEGSVRVTQPSPRGAHVTRAK